MVKSFRLSKFKKVQLTEGRALREYTSSGSFKKSSFFKKKFVLHLTKVLFDVAYELSDLVKRFSTCKSPVLTFSEQHSYTSVMLHVQTIRHLYDQ